ncbi:sensor histidine kinase [Melissospora conviva]|uniref:sensor histidine kinase n=1 Tax=Melissospora conviva TaxID=3388432 RepID=UPI003B800461
MRTGTVSTWRNTHLLAALLAFLVLCPAFIAPLPGWVVAGTAALATAVPLIRWPLRRVSLAHAAAGTAALSLLVDVVYPGPAGLALFWMFFEMPALLLLLGRVIRSVPDRLVVVTATACAAAALLLPLRFTLRDDGPVLELSIITVALTMFPVVVAAGIGGYLRSLDMRRVRAVNEARRDQRLRVAADLHDFVAHEVTGIVLEAQAAQWEPLDAEQARTLLARIEAAGLRALDSMDHTVQTLRDVGGDGDGGVPARVYRLADLPELVNRFSSGSSLRAVADLADGPEATIGAEREAVGYAVVLEALTNVRRHAYRATEVQVRVRTVPGPAVEIGVTDNGRTAGALTGRRVGGGTGLVGLEERVRALGGELSAGRTETGWCVRCVIPAPGLIEPKHTSGPSVSPGIA